jgi:hypothetical protein
VLDVKRLAALLTAAGDRDGSPEDGKTAPHVPEQTNPAHVVTVL